jgi:hypothetical protein
MCAFLLMPIEFHDISKRTPEMKEKINKKIYNNCRPRQPLGSPIFSRLPCMQA